MKIITDAQCANYSSPGHPERPARITATVERLKDQTERPVEWRTPSMVANVQSRRDDKFIVASGKPDYAVTDEQILRAHTPEMLARLQVPHDFDGDTPYYEGIAMRARASATAALDAMNLARNGDHAFSLMRPPGHHATRKTQMGFCYLNNIAIAVLEALATGTERVAVFDFDVHHGNGTEDILLNHPCAAFYSVHQFPCYPGTGQKNVGNNCFNYPVFPSTPRESWRATLARALDDLKKSLPKLVAVSAGFDAYERDPLAQGTLAVADFFWLGQELRNMKIPSFSLLEGGYSDELSELILAYLRGVEG